jgi:hypothetical protein
MRDIIPGTMQLIVRLLVISGKNSIYEHVATEAVYCSPTCREADAGTLSVYGHGDAVIKVRLSACKRFRSDA